MPQIRVIVDRTSDALVHSERVNLADFDSEHFRTQLAERLAWAVADAEVVERTHPHGNRVDHGRHRGPRANTA